MPAKLLNLFVIPTFLLVTALSTPAQNSNPPSPEPPDTSAQSAIDHGVQAFKAARYDAAIQHFQTAIALDPTSSKANLYLGTSYAYEVVPNLKTPENLAIANRAIDALKQVPETDPGYLTALREIASAYRNTSQTEPAIKTELHIIELDPSDPEAHYTLGVLDWQQSYRNAREILALSGLTDDGNGNATLTRSPCLDLRSRNAALVQDGLDHLTRAIELRPSYDDAMQYLQLTYRRRADLACGDDTRRTEDLAQAAEWSNKAMAARKLGDARKAASSSPR